MTTTAADTSDFTTEDLTDDEVETAVASLLSEANTTLDSLRTQAAEGKFDSERGRRAWFVIRGLGRG